MPKNVTATFKAKAIKISVKAPRGHGPRYVFEDYITVTNHGKNRQNHGEFLKKRKKLWPNRIVAFSNQFLRHRCFKL